MTDTARGGILLVDDEPLVRQRFRQLLEEMPEWMVVGEAGSGREAIEAIRDHEPDLVLLDIELTDMSGFDVISAIGAARMPAVVFVTAFEQHAIRAFEIHAVDYILKPVQRERLQEGLDRLKARLEARGVEALRRQLSDLASELDRARARARESDAQPVRRLLVKKKDAMRFVEIDDVRYLEAAGNYVRIHVDGASHLIRATMCGFENDLDSAQFVRIHRSTIVNVDYVDRFVRWFSGDWLVVLHDGTRLRASRHYVKRMRERKSGDSE